MKTLLSDELREFRVQLAVEAVIRHPHVLDALFSSKPMYLKPDDAVVLSVVRGLCKAEPCVKHVLKHYYKREVR